MEEHKFLYTQYIIVSTEALKRMDKGKLGVQISHGSVGSLRESGAFLGISETFEEWFIEGQRKITLKASESKLYELKEMLDKIEIPNYLVTDFGLTQLTPGTVTCLGVGPERIEILRPLFRDLQLL